MQAALVLAIVGITFAGLALFAAMCVAIRNDDRQGLPNRPPTFMAALTRRALGMTVSRPVRHIRAERDPCLTGTGTAPCHGPDAEGR